MSTAELKSDLHKYIVETDDLSILQQLKAFCQKLSNDTAVNEELSPQEERILNIGIEQANKGLLTSNEDVRANINQWIKEKQK